MYYRGMTNTTPTATVRETVSTVVYLVRTQRGRRIARTLLASRNIRHIVRSITDPYLLG